MSVIKHLKNTDNGVKKAKNKRSKAFDKAVNAHGEQAVYEIYQINIRDCPKVDLLGMRTHTRFDNWFKGYKLVPVKNVSEAKNEPSKLSKKQTVTNNNQNSSNNRAMENYYAQQSKAQQRIINYLQTLLLDPKFAETKNFYNFSDSDWNSLRFKLEHNGFEKGHKFNGIAQQ